MYEIQINIAAGSDLRQILLYPGLPGAVVLKILQREFEISPSIDKKKILKKEDEVDIGYIKP
jgi:hypothetical protein